MASKSTLLGAAGEHFVMAELLRRGHIAALAPQGVPNADIVVTDLEGSRLCSVQVKTRRDLGSDGGWHMKQKHETLRGERLFYCFVDFGKELRDRPAVHVVPSAVVADALSATHLQWLATPGRNGQPHNDGPMRRLLPDYSRLYKGTPCPYVTGWLDRYQDAWFLLQLEPALTESETGDEAEQAN